MKESWEDAKAALERAARDMKTQYDRHRRPSHKYNVGDLVWLESTNLKPKVASKKLADRRYGPFKIVSKVAPASYGLELPETWKIHNVFNETYLTPYVEPFAGHQRRPAPPPPEVIDDNEEYEIEEIIDSKKWHRSVRYLVRWKGYGPEYDQWVPVENLEHSRETLEDFIRKFPNKPQNIDKLPGGRPAARTRARVVRFKDVSPSTSPAASARSSPSPVAPVAANPLSLPGRKVWPRDIFPRDFFQGGHEPLTTGVDYSLPDEVTMRRLMRKRPTSRLVGGNVTTGQHFGAQQPFLPFWTRQDPRRAG